jgi:hypothetical protein
MNRLLLAAALACLAGCVNPVETEGRPCPCGQGLYCCSCNTCAANPETCPDAGMAIPLGPCDEHSCPNGMVCTAVGRCAYVQMEPERPPKVMLAVDTSGSMKSRLWAEEDWACCQSMAPGICSGYSPVGDCKWNWLKQQMLGPGRFLDELDDQVRFGLTVFPDSATPGTACAPGRVRLPLARSPGSGVAAIRSQFETIVPFGGTPLASALDAIRHDTTFTQDEPNTRRFVVLLTDGLPNCNSSITQEACDECSNITAQPFCGGPMQCLDDDATVREIKTLRRQGVTTLVVWYGPVSPLATSVLNELADAGGRPMSGDVRYLAVGRDGDLTPVFNQIKTELRRCLFPLQATVQREEDLTLRIRAHSGEEAELKQGEDWRYLLIDNHPAVEVLGMACQTIQSAPRGAYELDILLAVEM